MIEKQTKTLSLLVLGLLSILSPNVGHAMIDDNRQATETMDEVASQDPAKTGTEDAQARAPQTIIDEFHAALIAISKMAADADFSDREGFLTPEVRRAFSTSRMAQIASGPGWRALETEDKRRIIDVFTRFTVANFVANFDKYSGQSFEVIGQEDTKPGYLLVKSQIVKANGEAIKLDYLLQERRGAWGIIDIYQKGQFSELARRRAEFTPILKDGGADALIGLLETKIDDFKQS